MNRHHLHPNYNFFGRYWTRRGYFDDCEENLLRRKFHQLSAPNLRPNFARSAFYYRDLSFEPLPLIPHYSACHDDLSPLMALRDESLFFSETKKCLCAFVDLPDYDFPVIAFIGQNEDFILEIAILAYDDPVFARDGNVSVGYWRLRMLIERGYLQLRYEF